LSHLAPHSFVLGCPRSGTTFLLEALEPLEQTEVIAGRIFPPHLAHLVAVLPAGPERTLVETSFLWSLDDFRAYAARSRSWALAESTRGNLSAGELLAAIRRRRTVGALVFKEPFLAFAPDLCYDAVPESRVVIIHRDGRDCADSLQRKYGVLTDERLQTIDSVESPIGRPFGSVIIPWWVEEGQEERFAACSPYLRSVWMWREMVDRCEAFAARPDVAASGRVLTVRYDALMRDPLEVGRAVVEHVGHRLSKRIERRLRRAHTKSIGIHANRGQSEIDQATQLARPQLERLGYL
jgi:hypothetical protein